MRAVLIAILVVGCTRPRVTGPFTLQIAVSGSLEKVSPSTTQRNWASIAQPWVFEPLARFGPQGEIIPVLAARVEPLDSRRLQLWIRSTAAFVDGSRVQFEDVASALSLNKLRATATAGDAIIVESEEPGVAPEVLLARAPIFRRSREDVLGTGPFIVREEDSKHIVLQRRIAARGRVDRIVLQSYANPKEAFARTLKGDANMLVDLEPRWLEFLQDVPRLRVIRAPGTHANVVAFNLARFSKPERVALAERLSSDDLRVQTFGPDCVPPERSSRSEGKPLPNGRSLTVIAVPIFERFALGIRRELGMRGGDIRLVDLQPYFAALKGRDFDLAAARPVVWPPGLTALNWHSRAASNVLGYSNPSVDAALDARDWIAAQRALDADPPVAFVCTPPATAVVDARIKNPTLILETIPDWEVAP